MRLLTFVIVFLFQAMSLAAAQPAADPEALREARAMMDKVGIDAIVKQQTAAIRSQVMAMVQSIDMGTDKNELLDEFADKLAAELAARLPKYYDDTATVYARIFTLEELRQLNAFYDSPLGKKVIEKMPALLKECSELGQQMGVDVMRELFRSMQPELQKRGIQFPK
jgi:hypothetical protein